MKNKLITIILLLCINLIFSQHFEIRSSSESGIYDVIGFSTDLPNGTPEYPITPTSYYHRYKVEYFKPDGTQFREPLYINPDDYYSYNQGRYWYDLYLFDSNYSNWCEEHDWTGSSREVTFTIKKVSFGPWYFGGYIQDSYMEGPFPTTLDTHTRNIYCSGNSTNQAPDLEIEKLTLEVDGTTYDTSWSSSNAVPILKYGKQHEFNITIKNVGNQPTQISPYEILVSSSENAYPEASMTPVYSWRTDDGGYISLNDEVIDSFTVYIYENLGGLQLQPNTDYWMFIHLDPSDDVNEGPGGNNNNIVKVKFKYEDASGRIYLDTSSYLMTTIPFNYDPNNPNTNFKMYNVSIGSLIPVVDVNFTTEETTIDISNLPTGQYAIHINNIFDRQVLVKGSGGFTPKDH